MFWPPMCSAKTSLGLGHGTVVDIRTFMYEVRKQVKMKVSQSRKIHIMALPHGTGKACLSADKSAATPLQPSGTAASVCGVMAPWNGIPRHQVTAARRTARARPAAGNASRRAQSSTLRRTSISSAPLASRMRRRLAQHLQAAEQVQAVHGGQQVEERDRRAALDEVAATRSSCCQAASWPARNAMVEHAARDQRRPAPSALSPLPPARRVNCRRRCGDQHRC